MRQLSTRRVIMPVVILLSGLALAPAIAASSQQLQRRCGWFENPTPGNASLTDRDGTWIIATQGGHQAKGDWPEFGDAQWVETNSGHHGYGCACLSMQADLRTRSVQLIRKATAEPLTVCRRDKSLNEPAQGPDITN
ncbi:DUF4087 domain-containing protein [Rhodanobacter hydrolyticus]